MLLRWCRDRVWYWFLTCVCHGVYIRELDLGSNTLFSTIPSTIGSLTRLTYVSVGIWTRPWTRGKQLTGQWLHRLCACFLGCCLQCSRPELEPADGRYSVVDDVTAIPAGTVSGQQPADWHCSFSDLLVVKVTRLFLLRPPSCQSD